MALSTARMFVLRGRPPGLAGGINGSISSHWASVKSLGYPGRSILRLYHLPDFPDTLLDHQSSIGGPKQRRRGGTGRSVVQCRIAAPVETPGFLSRSSWHQPLFAYLPAALT